MQHEPGAGRQLPIAKAALASISKGGYPEALGRVLALLARHDVPLRLEQLALMQELAQDFAHLLPHLARDEERRIRGEQDIIVFYEPARALETLPLLLTNPVDRARLRKFLDRLLADPRLADFKPTPQQRALVKRIRKIVGHTGVGASGLNPKQHKPQTRGRPTEAENYLYRSSAASCRRSRNHEELAVANELWSL